MQQLHISELSEELQDAVKLVKEIAKKVDSKYYMYNVCAMIIDEEGNR